MYFEGIIVREAVDAIPRQTELTDEEVFEMIESMMKK